MSTIFVSWTSRGLRHASARASTSTSRISLRSGRRSITQSSAENIHASRNRLTLQIGGALALTLGAIWSLPRIRNDELVDDPSPPPLQASAGGLIPFGEVQKHNTSDDCWVVIAGKVYDLTEFAKSGHPGGAAPIHRVAGRDATSIFQPLHPAGTIENGLDESAFLGHVDPQTLPAVLSYSAEAKTGGEGKEREIDLAEIVGLPDFDAAAKVKLTSKAWAYMSSGATDQYTLDLNRRAFNHILFRPRIMVNVDECDTRATMMGQQADLPFFICPTGMAGLAHPLAERAVARAAGEANVIYMVSTNASTPLAEIVSNASRPDQKFFMQLYVDRNRPKTEKLLEQINTLGMKAIFVTVDAAAPGKREADERSRAEIEVASGVSGGKIAQDSKGGGIGRSVGGFIDPKLNWEDLKWLRKHTDLPIGLKGVQSVEDCIKAAELGVNAIYLSNHGGRALDTAPPSLYTLLELRKLAPQVLDKCEVYLDGGVRRGTDVIKALCLGAKGVGMGRPFLYGLTYGQEGVTHAIEIMRDEIETTMRLLGVTRLSQLGPHLLNTKALDSQIMDHLPKQP